MKLQLKHSKQHSQHIAATCIRGSNACDWLRILAHWEINLYELECYLLPHSISNLETAGIFIIFRDVIPAQPLLEPYYEVAPGFFIPRGTELYPAITAVALKKITLWERQVFHPTAGLIGFSQTDRFELTELIKPGKPVENDWSFAHPGTASRPPLSQIRVREPELDEMLETLKQGVDSKSIADLPLENKRSRGEKIWDNIKYGFFILLRGLSLLPASILSTATQSQASTKSSGNQKNAKPSRFSSWINRNLHDLQQKRDSEIKRLLDLFEKDTDKALEYALPLNSPYLNRGVARPSDKLSRRSSAFDLKGLRAGGAIDSWDVGEYYNDLQTRYGAAAAKEVEKRNFKKAAYIHAHLLGDFRAAANVLEQGGHYREAAVLYKDHLKNISAAAQCLERGGLYIEAIALYKELQQYEKTGDLYMQLNQPQQAFHYYDEVLNQQLANNDFFSAARVAENKLHKPEMASDILMDGWLNGRQPENCLKAYFALARKQATLPMEIIVEQVYQERTEPTSTLKFLEVLKQVYRDHETEAEQEKYRSIAFDISSKQVQAGHHYALQDLKAFFPTDPLIASDISRYLVQQPRNTAKKNVRTTFRLNPEVEWHNAVAHRNQFLALGIKNERLQLARWNTDENIEYYTWSAHEVNNKWYTLNNSPYYSAHVIITTSNTIYLDKKTLPRNKYFQESLIIEQLPWLKDEYSFLELRDKEIATHKGRGETGSIDYFSLETQELSDRILLQQLHKESGEDSGITDSLHDFFFRYSGKDFFLINKKTGAVNRTEFPSIVRCFGIPGAFSVENTFIVSTNEGCRVCNFINGKLYPEAECFDTNTIPQQIVFITGNIFVLLEKKKALLYKLDPAPKLIQTFTTPASFVAALPEPSRNHFLLLTGDGQLIRAGLGG